MDMSKLFQMIGEQMVVIAMLKAQIAELEAKLAASTVDEKEKT